MRLADPQDGLSSDETYDREAPRLARRYEIVSPIDLHAPFIDLIQRAPGFALDVGAGSGRDAAWLASMGHEVVAVEPSDGMRREAQRLHPELRTWLDDRLPDLTETHRRGLSFDLILLSAVWMHVPPGSRPRAFRKLITLLKPGGLLLMTLRHGPSEPGRPMHETSAGEVEALALDHGLVVVRSVPVLDKLGRSEVTWTAMALRLPDDGAGALPLLRGIILNDNKASTYKLALLRAVARIADGTPALATQRLDDDAVDVPLGLVALNWVRMFLPLVSAGLPQAPKGVGLGFAKEGFRALSPLGIAAQELRVGTQFAGDRARSLAKALSEARSTIVTMPAHFTRYPNSDRQVFNAVTDRPGRVSETLTLDAGALSAYGTLTVPGHVWRALQRLGAWIEPVLVAEWARMMRGYAEGQGRVIPPGQAEEALTWLEPRRDTATGRDAAFRLMDSGHPVRCVWTGAKLTRDALDIDHCFPWSAWACGDLWNLLPASRRVNQHLKRDLLPSAATLASARADIIAWWDGAWRMDPALSARFEREAAAALPIPPQASGDDVFSGLEWRRLRLRQDQQIQEWAGVRS